MGPRKKGVSLIILGTPGDVTEEEPIRIYRTPAGGGSIDGPDRFGRRGVWCDARPFVKLTMFPKHHATIPLHHSGSFSESRQGKGVYSVS